MFVRIKRIMLKRNFENSIVWQNKNSDYICLHSNLHCYHLKNLIILQNETVYWGFLIIMKWIAFLVKYFEIYRIQIMKYYLLSTFPIICTLTLINLNLENAFRHIIRTTNSIIKHCLNFIMQCYTLSWSPFCQLPYKKNQTYKWHTFINNDV